MMMKICFTIKILFRTWPILVDIFRKVINLNKSVIGFQINIQTHKLIYSRKCYNSGKETQNVTFYFTCFLLLKDVVPDNETETNKKLTHHFGALQKQFPLHFTDISVSKFELVRNPSVGNNVSALTTREHEQHLDISCYGSLKGVIHTVSSLVLAACGKRL